MKKYTVGNSYKHIIILVFWGSTNRQVVKIFQENTNGPPANTHVHVVQELKSPYYFILHTEKRTCQYHARIVVVKVHFHFLKHIKSKNSIQFHALFFNTRKTRLLSLLAFNCLNVNQLKEFHTTVFRIKIYLYA